MKSVYFDRVKDKEINDAVKKAYKKVNGKDLPENEKGEFEIDKKDDKDAFEIIYDTRKGMRKMLEQYMPDRSIYKYRVTTFEDPERNIILEIFF
ncbi:Uu.00g037780.m01.CDS01 [Anthostomella pinea]|uniref:Uu.00g037780.m01.CDS01 n=1 Tax=Anthostomella pinea TaxID=933095 RepID=A0AAI8YDN6_9PEZI|nr:Uu.00g037780.m01.CDS01 [Anthostomella pinea]